MKKKLLDFLTPLKLIIYGNMCSVSPSVFLSNLHIVIFIENLEKRPILVYQVHLTILFVLEKEISEKLIVIHEPPLPC